ncbi:hypothetical protein [Bacillus solimangrovi]|uniref:Amidohydrolase-related domain-containing protein n=1 Tax=Bacillus solimangrovi TaxID=1305675 RepID=A0A1E5LH88_9BACI|nr:hypothetical protein [Bacillus solimangrovi]OEH93440.1 hypothetical protein BFG57_00145 [Bacillus solimangrovi]
MAYIIDNGWYEGYEGPKRSSYIIEEKKIAYVGKRLSKISYMRMDISPYFISSGRIYVHTQKEFYTPTKEKERELIQLGYTTVVLPLWISSFKKLQYELKKAAHCMINSTLDYLIGVYIPFHLLTPAFIRTCRRFNVPFICVDITMDTAFENSAWGWLRQANFPNPIPLYPVWNGIEEREHDVVKKRWSEILRDHHLPTVNNILNEKKDLHEDAVMQIGLYPIKGALLVGSDLDYALYDRLVDEQGKILYDSTKPKLVVLREKVLMAGENTFLQPGFGRKIDISIAGRFSSLHTLP